MDQIFCEKNNDLYKFQQVCDASKYFVICDTFSKCMPVLWCSLKTVSVVVHFMICLKKIYVIHKYISNLLDTFNSNTSLELIMLLIVVIQ